MKAKTLLKKLHRLQSEIYDYSSQLEDKSNSVKSEIDKKLYTTAFENVGESGFEIDVSLCKMQNAIDALELLINK